MDRMTRQLAVGVVVLLGVVCWCGVFMLGAYLIHRGAWLAAGGVLFVAQLVGIVIASGDFKTSHG